MKIQLFRAPGFQTKTQLADNEFGPAGLYLLASHLREKVPDVDVEVVDGFRKPLVEVLQRVGKADIVGVTSTYSNYDSSLEVLKRAKEQGAVTAIGGANVTHIGRRILTNRPFVDYAVRNDGEEAIVDIALGKAGAATPNLYYRGIDGEALESLVKRNAPLTTLFGLEDITQEERESWRGNSVPVSGIRGCMKAQTSDLCDFCSIDHKLKVMNPELMWKQVKRFRDEGFKYFWEVGETLFPGYLKALLRTRPSELEDTSWKFYVCADLVNEGFARDLKALGTKEVQVGIETPNDEVLKNVNKKARSNDIREAIERLSANGIKVHAAFMYGLTGETPESAQRTYDFAEKLVREHPNIVKITTSHAVPFVGTAMFNRIVGSAEARREYGGNLYVDDGFDYEALTRIYDKHFTRVNYDDMEKLVVKTRGLMEGRGIGTSFAVSNS